MAGTARVTADRGKEVPSALSEGMDLRDRVDASRTTAGLALGDLAAIATFVVAGEISHGVSPIGQFPTVLDTFAPFLLGWLVVAPLAGVYARGIATRPRTALPLVAWTWVAAALAGQGLRATSLFHGGAALPFVIVSIGVGMSLLVGWRSLAFFLAGRGSGGRVSSANRD